MKKIIKIATMTGCLLLGALSSGISEASNLDTYRDLLLKKTYTIKYVNITPEERVTNKDKVTLTGSNSMNTNRVSRLQYKPLESVIVADGKKQYEEIGENGFKVCRLQNEKGTYVFTKYEDAGKWNFWGSKKNTVVATLTNTEAYLAQGESFGTNDMTRVLNAMLPDDQKSEEMKSYQYVDMGWLDNGQNYVDYRSTSGDLEIIRYYFDEYTLVKIASAQFNYDENGNLNARRTIIKINEFSPTPNQEYLQLPAGIKDNTKTPKEDEK